MTNKTIDKYQLKITVATAIIIVIFIICTSIQTATWKTNIEAKEIAMDLRIDYVSDGFYDNQKEIKELENQANGRDIQLTEIKVKLTNIEALLVEIKSDIKNQN